MRECICRGPIEGRYGKEEDNAEMQSTQRSAEKRERGEGQTRTDKRAEKNRLFLAGA
jgi:hypothetical protein